MIVDEAAFGHVSVIRQRGMALEIVAGVEPGIAGEGQRLSVRLESLAMRKQVALKVVHVKDRGGFVVMREVLAGGENQIILQRPVHVGIKLRGRCSSGQQGVEIRHVLAAHKMFIALVFFSHDVNVL